MTLLWLIVAIAVYTECDNESFVNAFLPRPISIGSKATASHHASLSTLSTTGIQFLQQLATTAIPRCLLCPSTSVRVATSSSSKYFQNFRTALFLSSSSLSSSSSTLYYDVCDVLVLGSGPAARAIASLVSSMSVGNLQVTLADQNIDRDWVPNYGVWKDEWEAIVERYKNDAGISIEGGRVGHAIDREWDVTDCFFGGSFDIPTTERMRIDRPYFRVDKHALQKSLSTNNNKQYNYKTIYANHISSSIALNLFSPPSSLVHDEYGTTIQLRDREGNMISLRTKLIVDCTGHESSLIIKDAGTSSSSSPPKPGFQIAYGAVVDVDETDAVDKTFIGPYYKEAMTLFDYRTDHYDEDNSIDELSKAGLIAAPTFMYVMPLQNNQVFFEETSLVARPAMSFQECKDRCYKRLEYLGIKVTKIHEEEFCYIPMGGTLPSKGQRVIALGGSASMVHAATGYHLCRCLMGAADLSRAITRGLLAYKSINNDINKPNLDQIAASAYHSLWTPENIRQRNFVVFGGEFLMKQSVVGLRGFFDGFFRLPIELWSGFLAGWPGLPNNIHHETWYGRLWYGLNFIVRLPPPVAADLVGSIISNMIAQGVPLPQSVTPFLGQPDSYEYKRNIDRVGDVAAKQEAYRMIIESKMMPEVPVDFVENVGEESINPVPTITNEVATEEIASFN